MFDQTIYVIYIVRLLCIGSWDTKGHQKIMERIYDWGVTEEGRY
jgi:hypothetical protein